MAGRKHRNLEELCKITHQISKAKVTPILQGIYHMQGPVEELDPDIETNKGAPSIDKVYMSEEVPSRSECRISEASIAPCSSYTDSACETASDIDLKTENMGPDESAQIKAVKRDSIGTAESPFVKSSIFDDTLHAQEISNLVSSCSSLDCFSENVDSKRNEKSSNTLSSCTIDESKLLLTEEHADDNHNIDCSKGDEILGHAVSDLTDGSCHCDSSSYVGCSKNNSAFMTASENGKKDTLESGGTLPSRVTTRLSKRLGRRNKDDQLLSQTICKGTNEKDQSLSTTNSDSKLEESNIKYHVHTGTASSEGCVQVPNNHENTSQLPEIKEVDLQKDYSKTCNDTDSYAEGCNGSTVFSTVVPKFSNGVDGMSSLGATSSRPCTESLHVDIPREHPRGSISDCFVNESLGMDTECSVPLAAGRENVTFEQTSESCSRNSDVAVSSGNKEAENIPKSHTEVETIYSLVGQKEPPLPVTRCEENEKKGAIQDSSFLSLKSECSPASVTQRNQSLDRDSKLHVWSKTECGMVSSPALLANSDSGLNAIPSPSQFVEKGLSTTAQLEKHNSSSGSSEQQQQLRTDSDNDESELVDDVKVCDICGDAGREELLAVCSRCNDGAEHTYCMQVMLDKVPEGEWLCEGCKFKGNPESQMSDKSEDQVLTSKLLHDKDKFSKESSISKSSSKFGANMLNLDKTIAKDVVSVPSSSANTLTDDPKGIHASKRQALDVSSSRSPRVANLPGKPVLSRLDSSKFFDANRGSASFGRSLNNSQDCPPLPTPSFESRMHAKLQSPRTKLTSVGSTEHRVSHFGESRSPLPNASLSFTSKLSSKNLEVHSKIANLQDGKSKPKAKQSLEELSHKQLSSRGPLAGEHRKEGTVRTFSRSTSFNANTNVNNSNVDDLRLKRQSQMISHGDDSKGLKRPTDGSNLIGRKNSFKLDPSMSTSATVRSNGNLSIPKSETKVFQHDAKAKLRGDATLAMKKDVGKVAYHGNDGAKNLSSSHGENVSSECIHSDKKTGQFEDKGKILKGTPVDTLLHGSKKAASSALETIVDAKQPLVQVPSSDDTSSIVGLAQQKMLEQSRHEADSKEDTLHSSVMPDKAYPNPVQTLLSKGANNSEASPTEHSLLSRSRNFSVNTRKIRCFKCNEVGHIAQFCPSKCSDTNVRVPASSSSARMHQSKNKWAYAAECVLLPKTRACENDKQNIQSNGVTPTNGLKDFDKQITNAGCGVATLLDKKVEVQNPLARPVIDGGENNLQSLLRERTSLTSCFATSLAIPAHDFIWQGEFEVWRSGKLSDIYDGIQAHLSTCASSKVVEAANSFPFNVRMEEIPRLSSWPLQFRVKYPTEDNIALYFFAKDVMSYEQCYKKLLENMLRNDLALKADFDGFELLIFTSTHLPDKSQRWNRLHFLWGVFREQKVGCTKTIVEKLGTSVSKFPCPVQLGRNLSTSGRTSDVSEVIKSAGSQCLKSSAQQNVHMDLDTSDSCKVKAVVAEKIIPVDKQSESPAHDTPGNSSGTDCNISKKSCAASRERDDEKCNSMEENISLNEKCGSFGNRNQMDPPCTHPRATTNCTKNGGTSPIVLGMQEISSVASKDSNYGEDVAELPKGEHGIVPKVAKEYGEELGSIGKGKSPVLVDVDKYGHGMAPVDEEKSDLDLRSNNKRPHPDSLQKTFPSENVTVTERSEGCKSPFEGQDRKRFKTENVVNEDDRVPHHTYLICDLNSSFPENEDTNANTFLDDKVTENTSEQTENSFFSVDFGHARVSHTGNSSSWTGIGSSNNGSQGTEFPNLELALGAGTRSSRKGALTLFAEGNHSGSGTDKTDNGEVNDDSAPSSLSLSLAFPASVKDVLKEPNAKTENILTKRPHVNTSLLLFGDCADS